MIKTILCAVDISQIEPDEKPLRVAARMAESEGAQLHVITVMPDLGVGEVSSYFPADFLEKAAEAKRRDLDAFVTRVLGAEAAGGVRKIVTIGTVYREVLRVAEAEQVDLIVVGAHEPDIGDYLLGSNASRIVAHSHCSVYVVR